jgi:transcriptional regulator with XRE-family HTH domain
MDTITREHPIPDLRARRMALGFSAEKVARLADCSTAYVRTIEHGYRPSQQMANRLDAALRSVENGVA